MSLAPNESQFSQFVQFLKTKHLASLPIHKAVTIIRKQKDTQVGVLGRDLLVCADSVILPEEQNVYTWLDETVENGLADVTIQKVLPTINTPLDTSILHR